MQYVSAEQQQPLDQAYRTAVIIVLAFCFTPLLLMTLGYFIAVKGSAIRTIEDFLLLKKVAYGGALIAGLIVVALRRFWFNYLRSSAASVQIVLKRLRLLSILGAVFGELVAIIGFIAYSLTSDYQFCWRLGVIGLLLILYSFPRRWEWERALAACAVP